MGVVIIIVCVAGMVLAAAACVAVKTAGLYELD